MDLAALTRSLVDIDSTTGREAAVGEILAARLAEMARRGAGRVERMPVEADRFNLFAAWGEPVVVMSTHMDTVPPFFPSSQDGETIRGRGACDAQGAIAAMLGAVEALLDEGRSGFGVLFVVGEETDSVGARVADQQPRGSRFLIDGEPTENRLALGSKGALYLDIEASGRAAHSAYPELGVSAIERLLAALERLRQVPLPTDPVLGETTVNVGTIAGGRAPNVIADQARAEALVRTVGDTRELRAALIGAIEGMDRAGGVRVARTSETAAMRLGAVPGFETTVVKFTTDIPRLTHWGEPDLLGPGSIHVAHTADEWVAKREIERAAGLYRDLVLALGQG